MDTTALPRSAADVEPERCRPAPRPSPSFLWLGAVTIAAVLALSPGTPAAARDATTAKSATSVSAAAVAPERGLLIGWTHVNWSPDLMQDGAQAAASERMLVGASPIQNAHIMGWGMPSPMPSPGVENFERLDRRVALMKATARWPIITLCCAPDWMKGGVAGRTDWSRLEAAPLNSHFDDFADLAARVARRYPEVKHFMIWNELKGFFDKDQDRWRIEDYTDLYNKVYRSVKAARPDALVGGPYIMMDSHAPDAVEARRYASNLNGPWGTIDRRALDAFEYWNRHKVDADFIVVDGKIMSQQGRITVPPGEALLKFGAVTKWLLDRTAKPIWWAELYPVPRTMTGAPALQQMTDAVDILERAGASVVLFWNPACRAQSDYGDQACLWRQAADGTLSASDWQAWLQARQSTLSRTIRPQ